MVDHRHNRTNDEWNNNAYYIHSDEENRDPMYYHPNPHINRWWWPAIPLNLRSTSASGISTTVLHKLPINEFILSKKRQTDVCAICCENYKTGDVQKTLPCFHVFYSNCVDTWLKVLLFMFVYITKLVAMLNFV